jgi:polyribonucleotide nucleotidyltransferase
MKTHIFKLELAGRELKIEFNDFAEQASGSCFVQYGDTLVLSTAVMSKIEKLSQDFFPLTVEYEERFYAAGKIRGSRFFKRESKPTDEAICNARLIDRTIRPLFPQELTREVQVVTTVLSWDNQNEPDVLGILAASLALSVSNIPWQGPTSAVRVGIENDNFILNPTYEQRVKGTVDVVFTATEKNNELLINMIEGGFEEIGEDAVAKAFQFAKPFLKKLIDLQKDIIKEMGEPKISLPEPAIDSELEIKLRNFLGEKLEKALFQKEKSERVDDLEMLRADLLKFVERENPEKAPFVHKFFDEEINILIHKKAIDQEQRADGRKIDELREISCQAGLLPRTHGSSLFRRGQTHALSILTLGSPGDQQLLEGMEIVGKKRFMHHYNFPPYSSGETKPMRGPGRREIGHGMLAEKALLPLIPNHEEFPYTIRVVTEILSSNGSTSMAAVSASCLALMDAGVPIKTAATGISLGLMSDGKGNYKILTDIQGPEDHYGDMDFKIAGTKNGITAIQMDVKISGITETIFKEALEQGKKARTQILETMGKTLSAPRPELSPFAPRILTLQINPEKIREVIGPGGKIINEIIDECGVQIDIEDSGIIFIMGEKEEAAKKALEWIQNITREVKVDEIFQGKIKRIMAFGAFAEILPGQEGLIHISQLAPWRVEKVEDIVKIGDIVPVKVISIDEQGRINLSLKEAKKYDARN